MERQDLHPIEEARGIERLREIGWDHASIASRFGRTEKWVARQAQLTQLIEPLVKLAADPEHPLGRAPVGVLERLASLPATTQQELYDESPDADGSAARAWSWGWTDSVRSFDRLLADRLMGLAAAPWDMDDAALYPEAGACLDCAKRSNCQPLLWDGIGGDRDTKGNRCLNRTCFDEKVARVMKGRIAEVRAKHGDVLLVGRPYDAARLGKRIGAKVVDGYGLEDCKKSDKGAQRALIVDGTGRRRLKWVRPFGSAFATPATRRPVAKGGSDAR